MLHSLITVLIGLPTATPPEPDEPGRTERVVTLQLLDPPVVVVTDEEKPPEPRAEPRAPRRDVHKVHGAKGCERVRVTSVGPDGRVVTRLVTQRKR